MSKYIKVSDLTYPMYFQDVLRDIRQREIIISTNPEQETLSALGYEPVVPVKRPEGYCEEATPTFNEAKGQWEETWVSVEEPESVKQASFSNKQAIARELLKTLFADRLRQGVTLTIGEDTFTFSLNDLDLAYLQYLKELGNDEDIAVMTTDHQLVEFDNQEEYLSAYRLILEARVALTRAYQELSSQIEHATQISDLPEIEFTI